MSEYQRYEFMTCDRPLTRAQLDAVNALSSHIEASATHALIEYHWGDFKHDPIEVLRKYFDGFLYWANWGSPRLALRFPHGSLPADLLSGYDFDDLVTFTRHADYDILDIHFGEMEAPDMWTEYDLGPLIAIRDELMEGDLRTLYVAWLASQPWLEGADEDYEDEDEDESEDEEENEDEDEEENEDEDEEENEDEDEEENEDEDEEENEDEDESEESGTPPVPPAFGKLTEAQQALAELLQVPPEMLGAAAHHSSKAAATAPGDDFAAWVKSLSAERKDAYLLRLVHNEPGLSRLLIQELRKLNKDTSSITPPTGKRVAYATLLAESEAVKAQLAREARAREKAARLSRLQDVHEHEDTHWRQVEKSAARGTGAGYDDALQGLIELRDAANQFNESQAFQERFRAWVQSHLRRPALLKRLLEHDFPVPSV